MKEQGRQHGDWVRMRLLWWQRNYILGEQIQDIFNPPGKPHSIDYP